MKSSVKLRKHTRGLSLIELMVALTIGATLIYGASQVYVNSNKTSSVNDSVAKLQETARYAMGVIETDLRMSNYWGLIKSSSLIDAADKGTSADASLGAPTSCGTNFARDLSQNILGTNNTYSLTCAAFGAGAGGSSDTVTVRRAAVATATATNGTLQICSTRLYASVMSTGVKADGSSCPASPSGQINNLVVNTYYISRDSDQASGLPSLRRKSLTTAGGSPSFQDVEIIPGIEDMQIQFGISSAKTDGNAIQYVNPDAVPASAQIVSVRVWLLVRSERTEAGFTDNRTYTYGDRGDVVTTATNDLNSAGADAAPYTPADGYRRLGISRTIQLRNALGT